MPISRWSDISSNGDDGRSARFVPLTVLVFESCKSRGGIEENKLVLLYSTSRLLAMIFREIKTELEMIG